MILEDFTGRTVKRADPRPCHVVVTSGKTQSAYHANKRNLVQWLRENQDASIADISYTTTARRLHHSLRFACTASTVQELISKLEVDTVDTSPSRISPVVFMFTGQGSSYAGMGCELYSTCPDFRNEVDLCASICKEHGFPPYVDIITSKDVDILSKDTLQVQLAVVTLEVALVAFWKASGVQPTAVMGHSLGEYVALHVAGVLSLADLLYLVGNRARLLLERCEVDVCSMLTVASPEAPLREILGKLQHSSCEISCINSPGATVVSGTKEDMAELEAALNGSRTKALTVPYGFHSFQMDPLLEEYTILASGVTYSPPKIPVVSTLLASVVSTAGLFNASYLAQQTRQVVNFAGALDAVKEQFPDPIWLEVGPMQVCGSFVRAALSPAPSKVLSTLQASTSPWTSISHCLAAIYQNGSPVDWQALQAPFADSLKLLTLPSYAWDLKDFWIVYNEPNISAGLPSTFSNEQAKLSTCAHHVVEESSSPGLRVCARAAISDPAFMALMNGHRMRNVSIVPGSAFCEAALAVTKYALKYSGRKDAADARLTIRNLEIKRPLTKATVGADGQLLTKVTAGSPADDHLDISWVASSGNSSFDLGGCSINVCDGEALQKGWNRSAYFVKSRLDSLLQTVKGGNGHRLLPSIFYALFSSTVDYDPGFKCIKEAFISHDFQEAAAEVLLHDTPSDARFVSSPYWGEAVVHLAGFLVNANPARPGAGKTIFMMDNLESVEQTVDLEPGRSYFSYVRVVQAAKDTISCDLFVFDSEKIVMECSGLRFHEIKNSILDRLLGNSSAPVPQLSLAETEMGSASSRPEVLAREEPFRAVEAKEPEFLSKESISTAGTIFTTILERIAKETGTHVSELTDDVSLAELGKSTLSSATGLQPVRHRNPFDLLSTY